MTPTKYWFRIHTDDGSAIAIAEDWISSFMLYLQCMNDEDSCEEYYFDDNISMSQFIAEMNESYMVIVPGNWFDLPCRFIVFVKNNMEISCESAND